MDEQNTAPETTVAAESSPAETQIQQEQPETSSEDVKAPESDQLVEQAMGEVKAPKSVNRVQELANRARMAELELQRIREMQSQPVQPGYDAYAQAIQQQEQRLARIEEAYLFAEAERAFPELDRHSGKYNKDFDDLVFNTYRSEGIAPKEAAQKVAKLLKLGQSRAESQLNEANAQKAAISGQVQRRSNQTYEDSGFKTAKEGFRKSGSTDDLARLLAGRI